MRAFNILMIALVLLLALAVGAALLGLSLWPGLAQTRLQLALPGGLTLDSPDLRFTLGLAGAGVLFLCAIAVFGNLSSRRWERTVVFHNPLGEVMVSLSALEDLGRLARADVPGVKDLKLRVLAHRRGLKATAKVVLFADANLPGTTEAVQEAVRRRLQDVVGDGQDIRPRVMVSKVVFRDLGEEGEDLRVYRPYGRARRPPRP
jgi:hypothetical protein